MNDSRNAEYMARMQGDDESLDGNQLVAAYVQGIEDLRRAVAGMTLEQVRARPVPGRWSTIECVSHVADAEIFFTDRIIRTLAMDRPLLMSSDEQQYIQRLNYQSLDLEEELDLIMALRRHTARMLHAQVADAWSRPAIHSQSGLVTLRQLVWQPIRHLRHHLPYIHEKRAAIASSASGR